MKRRAIRRYEDVLPLVEELGFLPLFPGRIEGFSLWEMTQKLAWFSDDEEHDPWFWRQLCAKSGKVAYGKFFNGKAGLISLQCLPDFVNLRRRGQQFETLCTDGLFTPEAARIMRLFQHGGEYSTPQIKQHTGGKGFERNLTLLQHGTFLTTCDFFRKRNKAGEEYGWSIGVLCKPETLFGTELVFSRFSDTLDASYHRLMERCRSLFPRESEATLAKFLE